MGSQNFEQMINVYHGIYIYCGIAAIAFLVLAAALFVLLKIPRVFSELTGRGAKKAIREMVDEGTATGNLTSRKIGEDGRRHRKKAKTGALGTARLRRRTGLTGSLAGNGIGAADADSMTATPMCSRSTPAPAFAGSTPASAAAAAVMPSKDMPSGGLPEHSYGAAAASDVSGGYGASAMAVSENYRDAPTDVLGNYGDAPTDVLRGYGTASADVTGSYGTAPTNMMMGRYGAAPPAAQGGFGRSAPESPDAGIGTRGYDTAAAGETMVLNGMPMADGFMVLRSIVEIHTDEVIG